LPQTTPNPPPGGRGLPLVPDAELLDEPVLAPAPDGDELELLRHEVTGLRAALASRATIDQARGILIARYRISPEQAFAVLVRWSQHRNIKLRVIAEALVALSQDPAADGVDPVLDEWLHHQLTDRPTPPEDE
jgi:hypothetical protein